jgi:integrase/recombinase XerD
MEVDKEIISAFKQDCRFRRFQPTTVEVYIRIINQYMLYLKRQNKDAASIGKEDLINYLADLQNRNLKQSYIDHDFVILHSFYDFLIELGKIQTNPIDPFRKRYLRKFKAEVSQSPRKCLTINEASRLLNSIMDTRDKTILLLLFKTGIRIHELVDLDVSDVDMDNSKIILKPTPKRSNRTLFIDEETADQLGMWLKVRETRHNGNPALFVAPIGKRMLANNIRTRIERYAARLGLHDSKSNRSEDKFTPHCCRHFFSTYLIRSGMPREYIKELRGDARKEALDLYNHIDENLLRESYLAHIPQLGI